MSPADERANTAHLRGVFLAWTTLAVQISALLAVATLTHAWGLW
jgi:hypothetical protein